MQVSHPRVANIGVYTVERKGSGRKSYYSLVGTVEKGLTAR